LPLLPQPATSAPTTSATPRDLDSCLIISTPSFRTDTSVGR
jgi:hypothetical protein